MYKKYLFVTAFVLAIGWQQVRAQEFAPVGTAVGQFLEIGVGARSAAMGEAYTAVAGGASAVFWNPAGLVNLEKRDFYMAYTAWPADISIGGFSFGINFGNWGAIALSSLFLNTGDMTMTTVEDPDGLSGNKFSLTNYAFGLTYSRFLTNRLSLGVTAKLVHEKYFDYGYNSWALDIGTLYRTDFHGLVLGMSILHFGPEVQFDGSYYDYSDSELGAGKSKSFNNYSLPINFRVGVAMDVWNEGQNKVVSTLDIVHPNNNLEQYNWGAEYSFSNMIFIRGGYKFRADEGGFAFGTGVKYSLSKTLAADINYAFSEVGVLPSVHRLSVSFGF